MIITKPVKLDEIEVGDTVVIKDDYKEEFYRKQALKVISKQELKNFELVCKEGHSGLVSTFALKDIFTVIHISLWYLALK